MYLKNAKTLSITRKRIFRTISCCHQYHVIHRAGPPETESKMKNRKSQKARKEAVRVLRVSVKAGGKCKFDCWFPLISADAITICIEHSRNFQAVERQREGKNTFHFYFMNLT